MIDPVITQNTNGGLNIPVANFGTYSGGRKVVTKTHIKMVDAEYTPPTWGTYFDTPDAKNKNKVLNGFYCPATFRVTGYLYNVTLTIGVKNAEKIDENLPNSRVVVDSITIKTRPGKESEPVTRENIGRIPVALLLESALKASQFTGRYTDKFSPLPNFEIVKLGYHLATKDIDNFLGRKRRGQPKALDVAMSDQSLKVYARHWHACPAKYPGGKDAYIANKMIMSDGSPMYSVSTRNRQLKLARDKKLIPQVSPKLKYKRNQVKRGTK
jgi:hypothetical protein